MKKSDRRCLNPRWFLNRLLNIPWLVKSGIILEFLLSQPLTFSIQNFQCQCLQRHWKFRIKNVSGCDNKNSRIILNRLTLNPIIFVCDLWNFDDFWRLQARHEQTFIELSDLKFDPDKFSLDLHLVWTICAEPSQAQAMCLQCLKKRFTSAIPTCRGDHPGTGPWFVMVKHKCLEQWNNKLFGRVMICRADPSSGSK